MKRPVFTQLLAIAAASFMSAGLAAAQNAEELRLTVGKSVVIDYPSDVQQISTSTPEVLDYSTVSNREILLHGKGLGAATLVVWTKGGQRTFYNVSVDMNVDPLRRLLKESFPSEDIRAVSSRDSVALIGKVSNKEVSDKAFNLAQSFTKNVANSLSLNAAPIDKQILLRVKFAELDRTKETQFGVNLLSTGATNTIGRVTTQQFGNGSATLDQLNVGTGAAIQETISDALNIFAFRPDLNIGAFIKALQQESILQILAEPNLVATNGKEAYFLVGGEFPVPVLQGGGNSGAVTVQFREFGIKLIFTPFVTENKTIKMHLKQEVSSLDFADGVSLSGFVIPALSTRRTETDVELAEGQSFVVSGLVDNRETDLFSKIPVLGSLPIFGALFKTKDEKKTRTDLIVLVTPELTTPLATTEAKPNVYMPRDFLVRLDPKDVPEAQPKKSSKKK
ncbi:MAG: pilus assembly protein N-terminal domain-containing protein [Acidobacteriia bacterium]|nr:pilus assembly protein N-terminal domain-containing protein [Terriglobia bacterium]